MSKAKIEKTTCYPNAFKVVWIGCRPDNAAYLYFPINMAA